MFIKRTLQDKILQLSKSFPVLLLTGARQVGKTTLLKGLCDDNRTYVSLDDPRHLLLAKEDPAMFLQRFKPPILIDEIQYAPELLPLIKLEVDKSGMKGGFWLTGSQHFQMMSNVTESLAGRVALLRLMGLSRAELIGQSDRGPFIPSKEHIERLLSTSKPLTLSELYELIWRGCYPAIALDKEMDWEVFYSSYVQTYLQRDVKALLNTTKETSFMKFLKATACRTGQLLNITDLARDADISVKVAKGWLSILEASGVVYLLEPWHSNLTKRLIKTPKLYFLDTGLCSFLTDWTSPQALESGAMAGAMLETWVIGELLKSYIHNGVTPKFYYYRDKDKREIDLIIMRDNTLYPIECKKTASPSKRDVSVFDSLLRLGVEVPSGAVICLIDDWFPIDNRHVAISVSLL